MVTSRVYNRQIKFFVFNSCETAFPYRDIDIDLFLPCGAF
jgi:hypothetical protein